MSTPIRPKSYRRKVEKHEPSSVIKRPIRERKRCIGSPIRHDPIARTAPREVLNAPKAKRLRQSRLFPTQFGEDIASCTDNRPQLIPQFSTLPIPRLYFENDDFLDMYSDDQESRDLSCNDRESVSFLTKYLTEAVLVDPPSPDPQNLQDSSSFTTFPRFEAGISSNDSDVPLFIKNSNCFHKIPNVQTS